MLDGELTLGMAEGVGGGSPEGRLASGMRAFDGEGDGESSEGRGSSGGGLQRHLDRLRLRRSSGDDSGEQGPSWRGGVVWEA